MERYINFLCDLLMIDDINVEFTDEVEIGQCIPQDKVIRINPNYEELALHQHIAHELRHQWQYDQVYGDFESDASEEEINRFKYEFDHYKNVGEDGYRDQLIEIDAYAFSNFIMEKVFKRKPLYSDDIDLSKIVEREVEIENDIFDEEIKDCMAYTGFVPFTTLN